MATAIVAAIGNGAAFRKGRDFAAWLGLMPKQMSPGDRTILGRITKRGNCYLRTLFMQGARAILLRPVCTGVTVRPRNGAFNRGRKWLLTFAHFS